MTLQFIKVKYLLVNISYFFLERFQVLTNDAKDHPPRISNVSKANSDEKNVCAACTHCLNR